MITLPVGIAAHVNDPVYVAAHLIELQGAVTHYFTDFTSDLVWNGHTWLHAAPFTVSSIVTDANGVQDVTLTFDEQAQIIQGVDQNEGMSDRIIRIHEAWIDPTTNPPSIYANGVMQDIANGTTGGLDFDETGENSSATLNLGSASVMTSQTGPRNVYGLSCVNGFGDRRCKVVPVSTTVAAAVAAGSHTVTPASMTGILLGITLDVTNANGSGSESVVVTAVTSTTFTATFVAAKAAGWTVRGKCGRTFADCTLYANVANFRGIRHALTPPYSVAWGNGVVVLTSRIFPGQLPGIP